MQAHRMKVDRANIERQNCSHKERIRFFRKFVQQCDEDPKRKQRLQAQECVVCFGGSRIGGSAVTFRQCAHCDERLNSGNTNCDVLCIDCAKKAQLCKHCGADIDLKNRRKREMPESITPTKEREQ